MRGSIATTTYKQNVEDAFENIVKGRFGFYGVLFQDVAKITFSEATSGTGAITLGQLTNDFADFTSSSVSGVTVGYGTTPNPSQVYGDIWINTEHDSNGSFAPGGINIWDVDAQITPGTAAFKILLEEISHSLGVDILEAGVARNSDLDNQKYTVTSYAYHQDMDFDGADGPHPTGLQLYDIAALQAIYGRNYSSRTGDTTYSHSTAFTSTQSDNSFVYTIWDGKGTDTIDASFYTSAAQIDLRQGRFSSIGNDGDGNAVAFDTSSYDAGNVAIAFYAVIENAKGTNASIGDVLIGNAWNNKLEGLAGDDYIYGDGIVYGQITTPGTTADDDAGFNGWESSSGNERYADNNSGNDKLYGGSGHDRLYGGEGKDDLYGQEGNDILFGGNGNDLLEGGLSDDQLSGGAGADVFVINGGFDKIHGGSGADVFNISAATVSNITSGASVLMDMIFDFTHGIDKINLSTFSGVNDFSDLLFSSGSAFISNPFTNTTNLENYLRVYINDPATAQYVTLIGYTSSSQLDANDFIFNSAPVPGIPGQYVLNEDTSLSISISDLVSDIDSTVPLDFAIITGWPSHGSLIDTGSGSYLYTPNVDYYGEDTITYQAVDALGVKYNAAVTLTVLNLNDAPYAPNISYELMQNGAISGNVLLNEGGYIIGGQGRAFDPEGDDLFALEQTVLTDQGRYVTISANGAFSYLPDSGFSGSDSFYYTIYDTYGNQTEGFASFYVQPLGYTYDGDSAKNTIFGGAGNDVINGFANNDTLHGNGGNDIINGGDAADIIYGGYGNDIIDGGAGSDSLYGGTSSSSLQSDTFVFKLADLGASPDSILGGNFEASGSKIDVVDVLSGFNLSDDIHDFLRITSVNSSTKLLSARPEGVGSWIPVATYYYSPVLNLSLDEMLSSHKIIISYNGFNGQNEAPLVQMDEFVTTEGGTVTGNLFADNGYGPDTDTEGDTFFAISGIYTTTQGGEVVINSNGSFEYSTPGSFVGYDEFEYTVYDGRDYNSGWAYVNVLPYGVRGGEGDDTINADGISGIADGNGGNDIINGTSIDESLSGGSGNDTIYGRGGDDLIYGGAGADELHGGAGIDTFYFHPLDFRTGTDTVVDFDILNDKIDISSILYLNDPIGAAIADFVSITEAGPNSYLRVDMDGTGNQYHWEQVAVLANTSGLTDEEALVNNGTLII